MRREGGREGAGISKASPPTSTSVLCSVHGEERLKAWLVKHRLSADS